VGVWALFAAGGIVYLVMISMNSAGLFWWPYVHTRPGSHAAADLFILSLEHGRPVDRLLVVLAATGGRTPWGKGAKQ